MPVRTTIRKYAPERVVMWYRRRRELRIYFHELGDNLWLQRLRTLDLQQRGEPVTAEEMVMEGGTGAWLAWAVHDIVERNDIVLKAMERKIEALTARHGQQIRNLREEIQGIQGRLVALEGQLTSLDGQRRTELPAGAGSGSPAEATTQSGADPGPTPAE